MKGVRREWRRQERGRERGRERGEERGREVCQCVTNLSKGQQFEWDHLVHGK